MLKVPSEIPQELVEQLKELSIRARTAMATECLTPVLEYYELPEDDRQSLLELLWRFVEEFDLGQWDDDREGNSTLRLIDRFIENGEEVPAESPFRGLPAFALEMINEIEGLACDNLYAGTTSYSPHTHERLVRVLGLALDHGFSIPSITRFLCSPFSERGGWGNPTPRSSFIQK
jgi:hypothetical protein